MDIYNWIVVASWLAFLIYWSISAINVKKDVKGSNPWTSFWMIRILIIAVVILLLSFTPQSTKDFFSYANSLSSNPILGIIADIFSVGGVAFAIWARYYLGRNWSGYPTFKVDHELVT